MPNHDELVRPEDAYKAFLKTMASIIDSFHQAIVDCADTFRELSKQIDAVEVIRCRDCDYYQNNVCDRWADGTLMCPDDYCSRALKAEGDSKEK